MRGTFCFVTKDGWTTLTCDLDFAQWLILTGVVHMGHWYTATNSVFL